MSFDDTLDALLDDRGQADERWSSSEDEPLLEALAAEALAPWRTAEPSSVFVDALEAKLLAHATTIATQAKNDHVALVHESFGAASGEVNQERAPHQAQPVRGDTRRKIIGVRPVTTRRHALRYWLVAAAAVLVVLMGTSVFGSSDQASPQSSSYPHRRFEQTAGADSISPRVRLLLTLADANRALDSLNAVVIQQGGGSSFISDLAALQGDIRDSKAILGAYFFGSERYAISTKIASIEAQARTDVMRELTTLTWADRLSTMAVLQQLGATIPSISKTIITRVSGADPTVISLNIEGSDFEQGVLAVINGEVVGTVVSISSTDLQVALDPSYNISSVRTVGVSNPDGTAVETSIAMAAHG